MRIKKGQLGFTLIELLVVISILGVLVAVAIPNVIGFMGKGRIEAANTEASNVQTAVAAYMVDSEGSVPDDTDELQPWLLGELRGEYDINENGSITGTGGWKDFTWENGHWIVED